MGSQGPFGAMGDPQQFADALRQFADMLSYRGGPVNWDLAENVARHAIVAAGDPERRTRSGGRSPRRSGWPTCGWTRLRRSPRASARSRPGAGQRARSDLPHLGQALRPDRGQGRQGHERHVHRRSRPTRRGSSWSCARRWAPSVAGAASAGWQPDAPTGRRDDRQPDWDGGRSAGPRGDRLRRHRAAARPRGHGRAAACGRGRVRPGAVLSTPARSGSSSPCAKPRTSGCSRTSRGCAHLLGAVEQYASGITVDMARLPRRSPTSTSPTPRRCRTRWPAKACSGPRTRPPRRPR